MTVLSHPDDDDNDDGRVRERRKTLDKEFSNKLSPPPDGGDDDDDDDGRVREKRLRTKRSPIHPTPPIMCLRVADEKSSILVMNTFTWNNTILRNALF